MPSFEPEGQVTALLGPTNTGKTHRAVQRMLQHRTGMIGLPLRLLAREVYDRVSAAHGEQSVALVTGEERRIPPNPRWWVCTVEAMPVDRAVSFLAVDEIQLAGDRARGHVFTDRLLRARGVRETMFLGSETIAPLIERLVPAATIEKHPRFSKLSHLGTRKLGALPRRTAIVAFSAAEVYRLAEELRRKHGGTAVVLGALSPRTRNAQVAMYQSGEVGYMVATDAIGMGLNMDVGHVAFAGLGKYDGIGHRALAPAEVGQIAGRAGRYTRDGTFGATDQLDGIPPEIVAAVEGHAYPPLKKLWWRNTDLDFSSVEDLQASLLVAPPSSVLQPAREEEDAQALAALAAHPEVRALADTPERVALLWSICQIPDFRKTLTEAHTQLLARVFLHVARSGRVPANWIERQIEHLDRADGDIDRLSTRIAHIRTWTYVTHRDAWLEDPAALQGRAHEVEDRLSDALHSALTARFVDRRGMVLAGAGAASGAVDREGNVKVGGYDVGTLRGIAWRPVEGADRAAEKAAARALAEEIDARVQRLVDAPHADFEVAADGTIVWEGGPVARLVPGPDATEPGVKLVRNDLLGPAAAQRVQRRAQAVARDFVAGVLAPLRTEESDQLSPAAQGLLFELAQGLGVVSARRPNDYGGRDRALLARMGVRFGALWCWSQPMLAQAEARGILWRAHKGGDATQAAAQADYGRAVGSPLVGGVPMRVDALEAFAAKVRERARHGAFEPPWDALPEGVTAADGPRVLAGLGFVRAPGAEGRWVRLPERRGQGGPRR